MSKLTLGADPELLFISEEGIVRATDYYDRQVRGGNNPEIGGDGHPYIVELRPAPTHTPRGLIRNIRDILLRHHLDVPEEICWQAGSFVECESDGSWLPEGKPLGGHIHFGGVVDRKNSGNIIPVLDGVLAQIVLLLEDVNGARKRRAGQYGRLSDVRYKKWGFEYRTLPSWIVSPSIATGVIALATAIVYEEVNQNSQRLERLSGDFLNTIKNIDNRKFINADRNYFLNKLPTIWDVVCRYRYWKTKEGKPLWQFVCLLKHVATNYPDWHNYRDILHRWGVRELTPKTFQFRRELKKSKVPDEAINAREAWQRIFGEE